MPSQIKHQLCTWERINDHLWTMYLPFNIQAQLYCTDHGKFNRFKLVCCSLNTATVFTAPGIDAAKRDALSQLSGRARYGSDNLKSLNLLIEEVLNQ